MIKKFIAAIIIFANLFTLVSIAKPTQNDATNIINLNSTRMSDTATSSQTITSKEITESNSNEISTNSTSSRPVNTSLNYEEYAQNEDFVYMNHSVNYSINDTKIIDIKTNKILMETSAPITNAFIGENEIFYISNQVLYRYHIPSKIIDVVCIVDKTNYICISPLTNMAGVLFSEDRTNAVVQYFDMTVGNKLINRTDRIDNLGIEWQKAQHETSNTRNGAENNNTTDEYNIYNIGEASLPLSEYRSGTNSDYPEGWYFNNNTITDVDIANTAACPNHNTEATCREYGYGSQCLGFACYVYEKIWGEVWQDDSIDPNNDEEYDDCPNISTLYYNGTLSDYFMNNILLGAHLRVWCATGTIHSIIILDMNENGITYYHCNYAGDNCRVFMDTQTWSEFASSFPLLDYFVYPNANQIMNCDHQYGTPTTYTEDGHTVECVLCGHETTQDHTMHVMAFSSYHTNYCSSCEYSVQEKHTYEWVIEANTHKKQCTKVGCGVPSAPIGNHYYDIVAISEDQHQTICTVCPYTGVKNAHTKTYTGTDNEDKHTVNCEDCDLDYKEAHSDFSYAYANASKHNKICGVCNKIASAAAHNKFKYTSNGEGSHIKKCGTCNYIVSNSAAHSWSYGSWSYPGNLASTCKVRTNTCSLCKQTKTDSLGHANYTYSETSTTNHTKTCAESACGYSKTETHTVTAGSWQKISSASQCRKRYHSCDYCTYGYYTYDNTHSYSLGDVVLIKTYEQCRKQYKDCVSCDYGYYEYYNDHDYTFTAWTPTTIGGFDEKRTGTCDICGFTYTFYREKDE